MEDGFLKIAQYMEQCREEVENDRIVLMYRELMSRIIANNVPVKIMAKDGLLKDEPLPELFYEYKRKLEERKSELYAKFGINTGQRMPSVIELKNKKS